MSPHMYIRSFFELSFIEANLRSGTYYNDMRRLVNNDVTIAVTPYFGHAVTLGTVGCCMYSGSPPALNQDSTLKEHHQRAQQQQQRTNPHALAFTMAFQVLF
jgi:hypothetical protein